jgi:hypothetical protein
LWELVVGLVFGIISSFIAWGILFHYLVPELQFAPEISKVGLKKGEDDESGYRYRFRIENAGRRDIIDIELIARVSIKGIRKENTWNTVHVPLSSDGSSSYRIPILRPAKRGKVGQRKTIRLYPNSTNMLQGQSIFPKELRDQAKDGTLLLDNLLRLGSDAKLEVVAFCYDSFSGTRKLFISNPYTIKDIREGGFDPASLLINESVSRADEVDEDNGIPSALT